MSWTGDDLYDEWHTDPPRPEAIETENPVVAELLGPTGQPLRQWRERRTVAFGFQRPRRKVTR